MTLLPSCRQPRLEGVIAESSAPQVPIRQWRLPGLSRSGQAQLGIAVAMLATIAATLVLSQYLQDQMARHLVDEDPNGALIVEAVISLARALGMNAIAEGVETEAQRLFLSRQGCHEIQGHLIGPPMPPGEIDAFLKTLPR